MLRPGHRYRVTVEGYLDANGDLRSDDPRWTIGRSIVRSLDDHGSLEHLGAPPPKWLPGDVVLLCFDPTEVRSWGDRAVRRQTGKTYTYVRGVRDWPGDQSRMTDAEMSAYFAAGQVTPVLQSGGLPFSILRLP